MPGAGEEDHPKPDNQVLIDAWAKAYPALDRAASMSGAGAGALVDVPLSRGAYQELARILLPAEDRERQ